MSSELHLTGMVLKSTPFGDFDRRVVLLTKECGKITAFAKGARRPTSHLLAAAGVFHFGTFTLYEGRTAYTLAGANITHYFSDLKADLEGSFYGAYFMELAEYYGRENLDASQMLNLLFVSLRALENHHLPNRLVRNIFEIKLMVINGEYPQEQALEMTSDASARYALQYVYGSEIRKLYTFTVSDEVLHELDQVQSRIRPRVIDSRLKSLEILESMFPQDP